MFEIIYLDDCYRRHLTFVKSKAEVKFYRDRFQVLSFSPVDFIEKF